MPMRLNIPAHRVTLYCTAAIAHGGTRSHHGCRILTVRDFFFRSFDFSEFSERNPRTTKDWGPSRGLPLDRSSAPELEEF